MIEGEEAADTRRTGGPTGGPGEHWNESARWSAVPPGREPDDDFAFDFQEILGVLRRRVWVLVGSVLVVTTGVLLVTFQLTPLYTATAQVLIDVRERNVADLESVVAGLSPDSSTIESQVEVMRSRSLATRVIEDLGLDQDAEFNPALEEPGPLSGVVGFAKGLLPGWQPPLSEEERREREMARVFDRFSAALDVSRVGRLSFVISISFSSESPSKAARIANRMAELYLVEQLEAKFEATRLASEWLDERLVPLRNQLRESEKAVEEYRAVHDLVDSKRTSVSEQQLSEVNRQLVLARAELAEKRARFRRVSELLESGGGVDSAAEVLASSVVTELRQQHAELARKQAELASRYGERHPRMIDAQAERKDLELELAAEVSRIVANLENEVHVAQSRAGSLTHTLEGLRQEAAKREQARVQLRELEREAAANRALFEPFLTRLKETREQQGIEQPDGRIISKAAVPIHPSHPNEPLNAALGLLGSVLLGMGAILLLERLDNGFRTPEQLETDLHLPHLVSVPELAKGDTVVDGTAMSVVDYLLEKPMSRYGEALRGLRARLLISDTPPRVILFTSSLPSEGKTTTAVSMGRVAAQTGMRVLLIDADLRHPSVAKQLGIKPKAGVVEYLAGKVPLEQAMIHDEASGLRILPVVSPAANPPDLLGSDAAERLLEKVRTDFEMIILDSPPVLAVGDAKVLSRSVDKVVFVAQWEKVPRAAARNAVRALRDFGADIAGVVFSRVDLRRQSTYGYGAYDYSDRYSAYYSD